jgi:RNA polymerase-binding transcription factor DksA
MIPKKKKAKKITQKQAKLYEASLLRLRDELSRQIAFLRGTSLTRDDEVNVTEDGSDAFERQFALKLAANEGDAVFEIDEALQRLREGTYAICEDCGDIITPERLNALPFARRCMRCKTEAESRGIAGHRRFD